MEPEYAKFAANLKEIKSPIKIGKVDGTVEKKLFEEYGIKGFPTIKFFKNGEATNYNGAHDESSLRSFIKKKTESPVFELSDAEAVKQFVDENYVAVIGFFKNHESSDLAKAFAEASDLLIEFAEFGMALPASSGNLDVKEDKIVLLKKFDEGRVDYDGKADVDSILDFVKLESTPIAIELCEKNNALLIVATIKINVLFFYRKSDENSQSLIET